VTSTATAAIGAWLSRFMLDSNSMYRVFIADDDPAMRGMLEAALVRAGFEVETAADGASLLGRLEAAQRDGRPAQMIISDICMPGMNGLDVLSRIRHGFPAIPVLLITAFGDALTHRRARALGAVEVIDKPFDIAMLCRRVSTILEGTEMSRHAH
jgi:DNA-binding NtrC family response regulator